jgi:SAM-dependent methyltransferase
MPKELRFSLGRIGFQLKVFRNTGERTTPTADTINLGYARTLEKRFPALRDFALPLTKANVREVTEFYADYIPLLSQVSQRVHARNLLQRLRQKTNDPALKAAATKAIAVSDLSDGLADRAGQLKSDAIHGPVWQEQTDKLEAAYGAALVREDWSGADRGKTLRLYLDAHRNLLQDKEVLHFAPEGELRAWIAANASAIGIKRYVTADGFAPDVDEHHDITALDIADGTFDVVICHRVMEHVLDDERAFAELYRVLRPGGLLSFSVPQAPHQVRTVEWCVPDETHDGHVRQYGADLEERMARAGFRVELEPWLLRQPVETLRAAGAYPMRFFHAWRDR